MNIYLSGSESAARRDKRNRELMELYCDTYDRLRQSKVANRRKEALRMTLQCGTPPYHIGFERAYIIVPQLLRGKNVPFRNIRAKLLWDEIAAKVKRLCRCSKMSIASAICIVIEQSRASQFFISQDQAWHIIKHELSRTNCRKLYGRAQKQNKW